MQRRAFLQTLGATSLLTTFGAAREARAAVTLKLAMTFPKSSPWGKAFATWVETVQEKTSGQLALEVSYGGSKGDEAAIVAKIKAGELDGLFATTEGLSKIYKPIVALEMPGLFASWSKLDQARTALGAELEKGASEAGFRLAGWADVGIVRAMSKGFAIKLPDNLKGKKPCYRRNDPVWPAVYSAIGASGTPLSTAEVLPNLNTGAIDAVVTSCLAAEQLQWASKLDNLSTMNMAASIGAIVFSSKRIEALPSDLRAAVIETSKATAAALTSQARSEDNASFNRLKSKMTVATPTADETAAWKAVFKTARGKLAQGTFSSDLVTKLEGYSG